MADFLDIEEMLEAPYKGDPLSNPVKPQKNESDTTRKKEDSNQNEQHHSSSGRNKDDRSGRDRHPRSKSKSAESRSKPKGSSRDNERGSKGRDSHRSSRSHKRSRSRSHGSRDRHRSSRHRPSRYDDTDNHPRDRHYPGGDRDRDSGSKRRALSPMLSPEERDARTIFVWQLAARIRPRDLEEFFSSVGEVRDVRLILDNKTRKSKGIAYVEFRDVASLPMALALSGSKVLGVPIQIQASQAEKNRAGQPSSILANLASSGLAAVGAAASGAFSPLSMGMASAGNGFGSTSGPVKLYVGSLHPQINEDMLRSIFEPFGHINDIQLTRNLLTNRSAGNGFVLFRRAEDAQRALDQLNGFELAGKNMKVSTIPEAVRDELSAAAAVNAPIISGGESLIDPATQLALMATKLVTQGNGQNLAGIANLLASASAMSDYPMDSMAPTPSMSSGASVASVDTPCFMLTNMFSPEDKNAVSAEIRSDVIEECSAHGSILHVFVDFDSAEGNVYVKARSSNVAKQCVTTIHGRYFSGRLVTAAYVPLDSYHELFPDSINANEDLEP